MQLKALEMIGFKSFSDKTTVTFQPGVTAVVGPNGCGKSNISDAIRWVLGEQSAKHLRGDKMEDVIFNGSESRKPMGMAEVTLRLSNVEGHPLQRVQRLHGARDHAPSVPFRRERIPGQQDPLPPQGHPRPHDGRRRGSQDSMRSSNRTG